MLTEQDKKELRQKIKANQHEIFILSIDQMDAVVRSSPNAAQSHVKNAWQKIKGGAEKGANYYANAADARTLSKLIGDLGGYATQAYIKNYNGKPHIILKGHPGLRKILTGTKYGITNPKVVTLGLGKAGAVNAAKMGGIISVVLMTAYRVVDYFLTDEATLSRLIGSLATDVVKIGIAAGASIAAVSAATALGITIAIGPIAVVVIVGLLANIALNNLDGHFGVTERLIAGLDELGARATINIKQAAASTATGVVDTVFDYAIDTARSIAINAAKHAINRFLSRKPRL